MTGPFIEDVFTVAADVGFEVVVLLEPVDFSDDSLLEIVDFSDDSLLEPVNFSDDSLLEPVDFSDNSFNSERDAVSPVPVGSFFAEVEIFLAVTGLIVGLSKEAGDVCFGTVSFITLVGEAGLVAR